MKEIKTWKYAALLYLGIVVVEVIILFFNVQTGTNVLPFGWGAEILSIMLRCILDLIVAFFVGMAIDYILRKLIRKTLIPNLVITIILYEFIRNMIRLI